MFFKKKKKTFKKKIIRREGGKGRGLDRIMLKHLLLCIVTFRME